MLDLFGRTVCLLSSPDSIISTAFSFSRKRTRSDLTSTASTSPTTSTSFTSGGRMTLSTFICISLAVITLSLSPSAYAEYCTPTFTVLDESEGQHDPDGLTLSNDYDLDPTEVPKRTEVIIREGTNFTMSCQLSRFHSVKWTLNNREITPALEDDWGMEIETISDFSRTDGFILTRLTVIDASTEFHTGEYKCTSVCLYDSPGANLGVKVSVTIAITVTVNTNVTDESGGQRVFKKFVAREKKVEIVCTAHVPEAVMQWYRVNENNREENMETEVCIGPDVELSERKKPPEHCKVTREKSHDTHTVLKLEIKRTRKEGNVTLKTISDFRRYICRVEKGDQHGSAQVQLTERVSATRNFGRGVESLTAVQGEELEIFCDIHGVKPTDFTSGQAEIVWTKDGRPLEFDESKGMKRISMIASTEKGKPYRVGYSFDLAETEHRGDYRCDVIRKGDFNKDSDSGTGSGSGAFATFKYYVRIKDKLGALWPFLGICGEVVILCTIILIYEKRRSKQEAMEESDTDASADQMNSNTDS